MVEDHTNRTLWVESKGAGRIGGVMVSDDRSTQSIMSVLDEFFEALNARDVARLAAACNFPQVRLASGTMTIWRTVDEFEQSGGLAGIPLEGEWHLSAWNTRHIIQASHDKVHVAVTFTRHRSDGTEIPSSIRST